MTTNEYNTKVLQKRIDKIAKKYKDKKVLLYGAGKIFTNVYKDLDFSKLNIVGIADKKFEKNKPEYCLSYKTFSPSEIDFNNIGSIIVTTIDYVEIIREFYFKICKRKNIKITPLFKKRRLTIFMELIKNL